MAKRRKSAQLIYGDSLAILSDDDVVVAKSPAGALPRDVFRDPIKKRAPIFGWIACFRQGSEFATFGSYIPVIVVTVDLSGTFGTRLVTMSLFAFTGISRWVVPLMTPRIGRRGSVSLDSAPRSPP